MKTWEVNASISVEVEAETEEEALEIAEDLIRAETHLSLNYTADLIDWDEEGN